MLERALVPLILGSGYERAHRQKHSEVKIVREVTRLPFSVGTLRGLALFPTQHTQLKPRMVVRADADHIFQAIRMITVPRS